MPRRRENAEERHRRAQREAARERRLEAQANRRRAEELAEAYHERLRAQLAQITAPALRIEPSPSTAYRWGAVMSPWPSYRIDDGMITQVTAQSLPTDLVNGDPVVEIHGVTPEMFDRHYEALRERAVVAPTIRRWSLCRRGPALRMYSDVPEDTIATIAMPGGFERGCFDTEWDRIREELFGREEEEVPEETVLNCARCGTVTVPGRRYHNNGVALCRGACTSSASRCRFCQNRLAPGSEVHRRGEVACQSCADDAGVFECPNCEEYAWEGDGLWTDDDGTWCRQCTNDLPMCPCGLRFENDEYPEGLDRRRCCNCQVPRQAARPVRAIQSHTANVLTTLKPDTGSRLYGVELEVGADTRRHVIDDLAREVWDQVREDAIIKHDGSIATGNYNGFEIVTRPLRFENQVKFWTNYIAVRNKGLRSHDIKTCGLHVHVTRTSLLEATISKLLVFINDANNAGLITKVARRYGAKGAGRDYAEVKKKTYSDAKYQSESRYEAFNLTNEDTVEFRMYRGSLNLTRILACLEFTKTLIEFCESSSVRQQDSDGYLAYLQAQPKCHSLKAVVFGAMPHVKSTVKVVVEPEGISEEGGVEAEKPKRTRTIEPGYVLTATSGAMSGWSTSTRRLADDDYTGVWARTTAGPIRQGMYGRCYSSAYRSEVIDRGRLFVVWDSELSGPMNAYMPTNAPAIATRTNSTWSVASELSTVLVAPEPRTIPEGTRVRALREIDRRIAQGSEGMWYGTERRHTVLWDEGVLALNMGHNASEVPGIPLNRGRCWTVSRNDVEIVTPALPVGTRVRCIQYDDGGGSMGIRVGMLGTRYEVAERGGYQSAFVVWDSVVHEGNAWPSEIPRSLGDPTHVWYTRTEYMEEVQEEGEVGPVRCDCDSCECNVCNPWGESCDESTCSYCHDDCDSDCSVCNDEEVNF